MFTARLRPLGPGVRVAEVVGLVGDDRVCQLCYVLEALREVALAVQVGVAEDSEVAEVGTPTDAAYVMQPLARCGSRRPPLTLWARTARRACPHATQGAR